MNKSNLNRQASSENELASMIEPLASYICAAERPRAVLASALAVLLREVEQTNQLASSLCGNFAKAAA